MNWFGPFYRDSRVSKLMNCAAVQSLTPFIEDVQILLVPHAGLKYSGICAAAAYSTVKHKAFDTIILLCADHSNSSKLKITNMTHWSVGAFGMTNVDQQLSQTLKALYPNVFEIDNTALQQEHSFFVQIPFIRQLKFQSIVPILCGNTQESIVPIIETILRKPNRLIVCSTDLSHINGQFEHKMDANMLFQHDSSTIQYLINNTNQLDPNNSICGVPVLRFLHEFTQKHTQLKPRVVCYYNSQINSNSLYHKDATSLVQQTMDTVYDNEVQTVSYLSMIYSTVGYTQHLMRNVVTPYERCSLLKLGRDAIMGRQQLPILMCPIYTKVLDIFVTVYDAANQAKIGQLNNGDPIIAKKMFGCLGNLHSVQEVPGKSVITNVLELSYGAAYSDNRFGTPKSTNFNIEITFLSPLKPISLEQYWDDSVFVKGLHGLYLTLNNQSAYFLPIVLVELIKNKEEQLKLLCNKANFDQDCYQEAQLFFNEGYSVSDEA